MNDLTRENVEVVLEGGIFEKGSLNFVTGGKEAGKSFFVYKMLNNILKSGERKAFIFSRYKNEIVTNGLNGICDEQLKENILVSSTNNLHRIEETLKEKAKEGDFIFIDTMIEIDCFEAKKMSEQLKQSFIRLEKLAQDLNIVIVQVVNTTKDGLNIKGCVAALDYAKSWTHITRLENGARRFEIRKNSLFNGGAFTIEFDMGKGGYKNLYIEKQTELSPAEKVMKELVPYIDNLMEVVKRNNQEELIGKVILLNSRIEKDDIEAIKEMFVLTILGELQNKGEI